MRSVARSGSLDDAFDIVGLRDECRHFTAFIGSRLRGETTLLITLDSLGSDGHAALQVFKPILHDVDLRQCGLLLFLGFELFQGCCVVTTDTLAAAPQADQKRIAGAQHQQRDDRENPEPLGGVAVISQ